MSTARYTCDKETLHASTPVLAAAAAAGSSGSAAAVAARGGKAWVGKLAWQRWCVQPHTRADGAIGAAALARRISEAH